MSRAAALSTCSALDRCWSGLDRSGAGTGFYQVTIGPIGAAKPTLALPSTAVARYEELLLPVLGPALPASKTFLFPVERGVDTQSFTVSNTADRCGAVDDPGL